MQLLLDSHALIWAVQSPDKLGDLAALSISNPSHQILISAATIWEISIKVGIGKLTLTTPFRDWMHAAIQALQATTVPISIEHAALQASLPSHHRDPFDRLLIAQALVEQVHLVSSEELFDR